MKYNLLKNVMTLYKKNWEKVTFVETIA
jgi:hypothetical protein